QIANIMLYCLFIFFWILVGLILWVKISWQTFVNGCIYWWCTTLEGMRDLIKSQPVYEIQYYGKTFRMNAAQVLHDKYMIWCGEQLWSAFVLATVVALVICLITFFVVSWILGRQGKQQSENEVTGGRQLTDNPDIGVLAVFFKHPGNVFRIVCQLTTTCDFIFALLFTLTPQNPGDNKEGDQANN
ncbi:TraD N-terminal domain-containing protein, partial [Enterobacter hormaechei subsp. steigerwaltii]|nr:TraD N-terminal domain-containing protein [Enterobacter hormaechei subsp. steigerwaltii]